MKTHSKFNIYQFSGILLSSLALSIYLYLQINPIITPDGIDILTISDNLYSEGCLSYLPDCTPTTTDHGPIYPLLVWLVKIFNVSPVKIIIFLQNIFHILICSVVTLYLKKSTYRIFKNFHRIRCPSNVLNVYIVNTKTEIFRLKHSYISTIKYSVTNGRKIT